MLVPNTIMHRIAESIYKAGGSMTSAQIVDAHPSVNPHTLRSSLGKLTGNCHVERDENKYTLSAALRRYFSQAKASAEPQPVAARREYNPFATSLHPSRIPSPYGQREGSNEFRNWKSIG